MMCHIYSRSHWYRISHRGLIYLSCGDDDGFYEGTCVERNGWPHVRGGRNEGL